MAPSARGKQMDPAVASLLTSHLLNKGLFLTYRLLSRELALHVQEARSALLTFYEQQGKEKLKACWVVQGTLKAKNGHTDVDEEEEGVKEEAILLVGQEKLQDTIARFSPAPSVQIYSLSPASPSIPDLTSMDLANFSTVPLLLFSEAKYTQVWEQADRGIKLGIIYNEKVSEGDPRAVAAAREQAKLQGKTQVQTQAATMSKKPTQDEKKMADSGASTSQTAKSVGLDWSKSKGKPAAEGSTALSSSKPKPSKKPEAEPKVQEEDEAYDSDVEMAQIGYADSEGEEDKRPTGAAKTKRADAVSAKKSTAGEKGTAGKTVNGKTLKGKSASKADLEKMMDMDDDGPGEAIPDVKTSASATTSVMKGTEDGGTETRKAAPVKHKVRRQKRTVRKQRSKDEKGYMRTQEISDYESYSDWTESEEAASSAQKQKDFSKTKSSGSGTGKSKAVRNECTASSAGTASRAEKDAGWASGAEEAEGEVVAPSSDAAKEERDATVARPSKSPSPSKQSSTAGQKSSGRSGSGGAGSSKAKGGQSKLSSFFKKG